MLDDAHWLLLAADARRTVGPRQPDLESRLSEERLRAAVRLANVSAWPL